MSGSVNFVWTGLASFAPSGTPSAVGPAGAPLGSALRELRLAAPGRPPSWAAGAVIVADGGSAGCPTRVLPPPAPPIPLAPLAPIFEAPSDEIRDPVVIVPYNFRDASGCLPRLRSEDRTQVGVGHALTLRGLVSAYNYAQPC